MQSPVSPPSARLQQRQRLAQLRDRPIGHRSVTIRRGRRSKEDRAELGELFFGEGHLSSHYVCDVGPASLADLSRRVNALATGEREGPDEVGLVD